MEKVKVGRKKGFKLSQESRDRISKSHIGLTHDQETKDKIGSSMRNVWGDLKDAANKHQEVI